MRAMRALNRLTIIMSLYAVVGRCKIMRNNALMNKMMSQFQRDNSNNLSLDPIGGGAGVLSGVAAGREGGEQRPAKVLALMQTVLCKNFPSIPCKLIVQDHTLSRLIQKSIQQINIKKLSLEKTTQPYEHKTKYPLINSEDLSNFLQVQNTGYFDNRQERHKRKKQKPKMDRANRSKENGNNSNKHQNGKRTSVYGRKKLRKFYPHKVKYKDKTRKPKPEFTEYSEEKMSMSVEVPEMSLTKQHQHYAYKREPADPAVWRIDYAKHGGPSLNLLGSLTKTQGNGGEEHLLNQSRKDVLHPDVYIKKNFVRKNSELVD